MKIKLLHTVFIVILFISCGKTNNNQFTEINCTNSLSINDSIIDFSGVTNNGTHYDAMSLNRKKLFIYFFDFNKEIGISLINDEILSNDIGRLAAEKNVDVIFISDLKMAKIYE